MRNDPKSVGERSEGMILAEFLRAGEVVLTPFGDNQRYDLVLDRDGAFVRVQCKTGRVRAGYVAFSTCSSQSHRGRGKQDYRGQADVFAVYAPDIDKMYVVPVDAVGRTEARLRLTPTKNKQSRGVRAAIDFEFSPVAQR